MRSAKKLVGSRWSASLTREGGDDDEVLACVEDRVLALQGRVGARSHLEPAQLLRHTAGDANVPPPRPHTDWFADPVYRLAVHGGNRVSSVVAFAGVRNDTTGGGVRFPNVDPPRDPAVIPGLEADAPPSWCGVVDCDEARAHGVVFRPIAGNAIFVQNLHADGAGDKRTVRATRPITSGEEMVLNLWTRQAPLRDE